MKDVVFLGDSLRIIKSFPQGAKHDIGQQIYLVQRGDSPTDWKPMPAVGQGVREIRVRTTDGAYRVIYIASIGDAVYVLHAFIKKTQRTRRQDLNLAATRLADLLRTMK